MLPENTFCRGMPAQGAHLAEELAELITLHDASTIAAVIVEPMAGSAGVIPPPVGYLQRLRALCDQHDILLIFDEVITGLGRCGAYTGAEAFGVTPDILNLAKQITNGAVPMGAVMATPEIYETFMAHGGPDYALEFAHGYTYSGHPVACAAGLAALEVLVRDELPARVASESRFWESLLHEALAGKPHVADVRNYGFAGALTLESYPASPCDGPLRWQCGCGTRVFWSATVATRFNWRLTLYATRQMTSLVRRSPSHSTNWPPSPRAFAQQMRPSCSGPSGQLDASQSIHPVFEHIQWQCPGAEQFVMKVADVEGVAECCLGLTPQFQHLQLADFVSQRLSRPANVAINFIDYVSFAFGGVGEK
ncbi:MAG: hypothetical protein CM15mP74_07860 [Halieaceae bacterium]|nr:MAG: hypothetical protein CM15mP74_07860 [Halieaceae bacterium]